MAGTDSGSNRVLGLDVEVTNRCNARCVICPREEIERPLGMMSGETFRKLADRIRASSVLGVIFSGFGEPLLHPSLPEYVRELRGSFRGNVQINTNGSALTPEVSRALIDAGLDFLNVSYNGPSREEYERVMQGMRFERLQNNLREFIRIRGGKRKPVLSLQSSMPGAGEKSGQIRRVASLLGAELLHLYSYNNRAGHLKGGARVNEVPLQERFCYRLLFVAWDGTVYPCSHDIKGDQPLGSILDLGFHDIRKQDFPICAHCTIGDQQAMRTRRVWENRLRHVLRRLVV